MKLAVKFYKDCPETPEHKAGIPGQWPALVRELADGEDTPGGFTAMSPEEYELHIRGLHGEYQKWETAKGWKHRQETVIQTINTLDYKSLGVRAIGLGSTVYVLTEIAKRFFH